MSTTSDSLPVKSRLEEKLHPNRYPRMPAVLAAILGFVIDAPFGNPRIVEMSVTPERVLLARPEGADSFVPVARYDDLLPTWLALLDAARLKTVERMEAESLFAAKIGYFGRVDA